ncbi:hypothetical protein GUJ93_ZPchr0004g39066 [Zizania palustris]|uniref:Uncharacterized protein n=1 Tax=Zizania palustris TaxID=103762 RepID=A0A8J5SZV3_ZIZPA|nr:hypothetical protein GUJ93_ZPchr0004g39066 [Zizania palustris]
MARQSRLLQAMDDLHTEAVLDADEHHEAVEFLREETKNLIQQNGELQRKIMQLQKDIAEMVPLLPRKKKPILKLSHASTPPPVASLCRATVSRLLSPSHEGFSPVGNLSPQIRSTPVSGRVARRAPETKAFHAGLLGFWICSQNSHFEKAVGFQYTDAATASAAREALDGRSIPRCLNI